LISYGSSPRGSINLAIASKAQAFLNKRAYVIPEDVRFICNDVLRHRIGLTYEAEAENVTTSNVIEQIIQKINLP
jgi:MoxR-like ATPase